MQQSLSSDRACYALAVVEELVVGVILQVVQLIVFGGFERRVAVLELCGVALCVRHDGRRPSVMLVGGGDGPIGIGHSGPAGLPFLNLWG